MAAPERFAETSDSSCTAGAVHTWPISEVAESPSDVRFRVNTGLVLLDVSFVAPDP
jgi:hypothetical protein